MTTAFDDYERHLWAGGADAYSRSFAKLCAYPAEALLDAAGVTASVRLLDVGTGPGTVAALASARGAMVTAVDAEPSMVELARHNVRGADVRRAVLPGLPFDDGSFDAVVANFVLNHVGDPGAAVAELGRVVRPGGAVAVTVWPQLVPPLQSLWQEVMSAAGVTRPASIPTVAADLNFERTPAGLESLLQQAKLTDVTCRTMSWHHQTDLEEWWIGPASGLGALGMALTGQPADVLADARLHYERLAARHLTEDGVLRLPTTALLAAAVRPARQPG
jgi:SAM-dependent methyltransferase